MDSIDAVSQFVDILVEFDKYVVKLSYGGQSSPFPSPKKSLLSKPRQTRMLVAEARSNY